MELMVGGSDCSVLQNHLRYGNIFIHHLMGERTALKKSCEMEKKGGNT